MATRHPPVFGGRVERRKNYFVCDACGRACFGYAYQVGAPFHVPWQECVECWMLPRTPPMPALKGLRK